MLCPSQQIHQLNHMTIWPKYGKYKYLLQKNMISPVLIGGFVEMNRAKLRFKTPKNVREGYKHAKGHFLWDTLQLNMVWFLVKT